MSGITDSVYNDHGELEEETDERGVTVVRTYDALDRLLSVSYPDPSLDVTYTYDAPGAFARGRLTGITRHGETLNYEHDRFGRMTRDGDLVYAYDRNNNRTRIDYPDAVSVTYTYDYADRQKTLSLSVDGSAPVTLADNASYKPSGPLTGLAMGNGLTESRTRRCWGWRPRGLLRWSKDPLRSAAVRAESSIHGRVRRHNKLHCPT